MLKRRVASGESAKVLQKYSSSAPQRDHAPERVSIIARMKKALRPAHLLRPKSFDQLWS
jgi:hypothetical protein